MRRIRIDDRPQTAFGTFPHDHPVSVQVTLNLDAAPTAHIVLPNGGASGQTDYTIQAPFVVMARQFGAIRAWIGWPQPGPFNATNIVVTKAP